MTLQDYFKNTAGTGILATADNKGRVDAAIYSRPHIMEDGSLAFIMRERLTLNNLRSNPYATFLFMERTGHLQGMRLFLNKTREDTDQKLIAKMTRRSLTPEEDRAAGPKHIVYFTLERILSLVGPHEIDMDVC